MSVEPDEIRLKMLDMFAGRGTASKPFRDRGWQVTTIDLDPTHRPDVVADLSAWMPSYDPGSFDFVWSSPPCQVFSRASGGRHFRRDTEKRIRNRWKPGKSSGHFSGDESLLDGPPGPGHLVGPAGARSRGPGTGHPDGHNLTAGGSLEGATIDGDVRATAYPYQRSRVEGGDLYPITAEAIEGVKLVKAALVIIDYLDPPFWSMENPQSSLRSIIGMPTVTTSYCQWGMSYLKPTDLWGDLPPGIDWNSKMCREGVEDHTRVRSIPDPVKRAEVPYQLGWALARSIEWYFLDGSLIPGIDG